MASKKKKMYRLNPRHSALDRHKDGDVVLTHEPVELTAQQAKKVLESVYRGAPLAIKVEVEVDDSGEVISEVSTVEDTEAEEDDNSSESEEA